MFVYWPGKVDGGLKTETPVIGSDFYPTFLELAGLPAPDNYTLDGRSIIQLFKENGDIAARPLFWHFPAYLESYKGMKDESRDTIFRTRPVSVIRKGDWKLLMFHEEWSLDGGMDNISTNNSIELYNLKNDIGEKHNLALENTDKRDELLRELLDWQTETGAPVPDQANPDYKSE
jgi:arylsulfatase A-like enzyme